MSLILAATYVNQIRAEENDESMVTPSEGDKTNNVTADEIPAGALKIPFGKAPSDDPVTRMLAKPHTIQPSQEQPILRQPNVGMLLPKSPLFRQKSASRDHKMLHFG